MPDQATAEPGRVLVEPAPSSDPGVNYHFPIEVEVHSALDDADLEQVAKITLKLLTHAVRSK